MTIKELEEALGMTRANIRFYEQEGLLSPARLENGYRDYSPADLETLRKIKLLRKLDLDLNAIRAVQAGTLPLPDALAAQLAALERDQSALDRARTVCEALRRSGADYARLDAAPWLAELDRAPAPEAPRYAPPLDEPEPSPSVFHPWQRYFARGLDLAIYGLILVFFQSAVLHLPPKNGVIISVLSSYLTYLLLFLFEPLMLHFWGTTPGKLIFGLSVRNADGEKFTYKAALKRLWVLFGKGLGYGIPIYSVYRLWKSYKACIDGDREPWEEEQDDIAPPELYRAGDMRPWRAVVYAGAGAACLALVWLSGLQGLMPPHRGALTAADYYENVNFYNRYLDLGLRDVGPDGNWIAPPPDPNIVVITGSLGPSQYEDRFDVTLTDGAVTGAAYTLHAAGNGGFSLGESAQAAALLAYVGALPETNCLNFKPDLWVRLLGSGKDVPEDGFNYSLNLNAARAGVGVRRQVKAEGLELRPDMAFAEEGKTGTLDVAFQVEREVK